VARASLGFSSVKGLVFDFDGVLIDTEATALSAWQAEFAAHGVRFPAVLHRSLVGSPRSQEVLHAALTAGLPPGRPAPVLADWARRNALLANGLGAREGVEELLRAAAARGIALAVASGASREWVIGHLERLGLLTCFDAVVTGEGRDSKPSPAVYLEALRLCELRPQDAVAFEDSAVGVAAAQAAGIYCIAISPSASSGADLRPSSADVSSSGADLSSADAVRTSLVGIADELAHAELMDASGPFPGSR